MCETGAVLIASNIVNEILKVESIEEAFSCFLVHRPDMELEKLAGYEQELSTALSQMPTDQQEIALRQYLNMTATMSNHSRLKLLMGLIERLVHNSIVSPRMVCECVMSCDKLVYQNQEFWVECFNFVNTIIGGVEYKGVREIMKSCTEKARTLPKQLMSSTYPQMSALMAVATHIVDREASLLPGYLLVNELQKAYPDSNSYPHWQLAHLFSDYIESFRPCAQMVSIVGHEQMRPVVEHSSCPEHLVNPWKLDPVSLKFTLKGTLPYAPELVDKQTGLLRYVLEQQYSRDMVCRMLGLQKGGMNKMHCAALEEQLVELLVLAMERTEIDEAATQPLWLHLSSQLIYFVLQFTSFPNIVEALCARLAGKDLRKGRDHLVWVLLQFISGSIQRNPLSNFLPVKGLCELLFPDNEPPLAVPDFNQAHCTRQMAMTCIWIHLFKKAQSENANLQWPVPSKLKVHHDFLHHLAAPTNTNLTMGSDFRIALLCNAFSTNQDYFSRPMAALVETILGKSTAPATAPPTTPLSMAVLDSLTVHSKMSLIHSIVTHVIKLAQQKSSLPLAPALVETYSRLLVYTEIESLGIKGFIGQLLPTVFKSNALGTLYLLLEMFSYRMHHIQSHYRVQLLADLHSIAQTNHAQLHLCVESTALRLITGLGSGEVQPQLSRFLSEPKTLVSAESEELNRALVLTLARALHITGASGEWCQELLTTITQCTPHAWAQHTLECFPKTLHDFFLPLQNQVPKENKQQLKKAVEEEYRNWASMNNENDIFAHFSKSGTPPLFLCLLWKMLLDTDRISSIAYKILERIAPRAFSAHLRKFCDCLVFEFSNSPGGQHVNKCVDTINDMIWKYHIVTIDRLVLCLALRTQEGSEAQVCFFIIQLLLLKAAEFRNRVQEFVKENSPDHWKQSNWHEKHLAFHRKFPEKFAPEEQGATSGSSSAYHPLPVYFGNVCLRFLPVFDIVIHRYLEIPQVTKSLEILLEHLGILYKFHDRPVTYLYNTLHYYESKLREKPLLKRKLVGAVLGSCKETLSEQYQAFLSRSVDDSWIPELDFYLQLVKRVTDTMTGANTLLNQTIDWRFNEFPNAGAHSLYLTCVELMALPVGPQTVANSLLDVVAKGYTAIPPHQLQSWINSVGLLLSALPESYWMQVQERIVYILGQLSVWQFRHSPFTMFQLQATHDGLLDNRYSFSLALIHSVWHHAGPGQIASIPRFVKERLPALVKTEAQFLFVCHLIGPFMQRCAKSISELTVALYELLAQVDQQSPNLKYIDPICDLLYHIKYMYVGDSLKKELENIIRHLSPSLQLRLRFIAHIGVENSTQAAQNVSQQPQQQQNVVTPNVPQQSLQAQQQQNVGFTGAAGSVGVMSGQQILPT